MNVLNRFKSLSVSYRIHLQWIPSHVNIQGNEIADALAKAGADDASVPSAPLTYLELLSRAKSRNKTIWLIPPMLHWYQGSQPGGCRSIDCSRRDQTILRSLTFSDNSKCFEICPNCTAEQATLDHILACLGLSKRDLVSKSLLQGIIAQKAAKITSSPHKLEMKKKALKISSVWVKKNRNKATWFCIEKKKGYSAQDCHSWAPKLCAGVNLRITECFNCA
ncbi:hypothetical protein AVEN_24534-1 [Araneus ventricosus]|uniref:RNase H type-1 domain-containing protein n=1 Tax=Araneus ventricosus TaxID=182803 RepID=A0A4Y2NJT6_ARAVE|nr:hypothetical protein AVEN_24534-1 [Araneus ventricosus]